MNEWSFEFGDFIILNRNALLINMGHRTSRYGVKELYSFLNRINFEECGVISLPQFITLAHLDLSCNIIGPKICIAAPFLHHMPIHVIRVNSGSRWQMFEDYLQYHGFNLLWLSANHNNLSYINFLNINPETLLISNSAIQFDKLLNGHKIKIIHVEISELEKGGGSIRCLTLPLQRETLTLS